MSIYATLWEIKVPRGHRFDDEWVCVFAQAVPPHIGHPSEYPNGDPFADFLPPVVAGDCEAAEDAGLYRAVVIVQEGRDKKDVQRYVDPLIVLTGEEYLRTPFHVLLERIHEAIGWDKDVAARCYSPEGQAQIIRLPGWLEFEERDKKRRQEERAKDA